MKLPSGSLKAMKQTQKLQGKIGRGASASVLCMSCKLWLFSPTQSFPLIAHRSHCRDELVTRVITSLGEAVESNLMGNEIISAAKIQGGESAEVFAEVTVNSDTFVLPTMTDIKKEVTQEVEEEDGEFTIIDGSAVSQLGMSSSTTIIVLASTVAIGVGGIL